MDLQRKNHELVIATLGFLENLGVRDFCLCAGARNAPLIAQLEVTTGVSIFSFFEERSAAFFALGRAQIQKRPVALVVTSGTAVAEALPAMIEAHYQGLPLVVISADRPRRYRGSGAPQSIEQVGLFGPYVEASFDIENLQDLQSLDLSKVHENRLQINLCLEEPVGEQLASPLAFGLSPKSHNQLQQHELEQVEIQGLGLLRKPLVIVSSLAEDERPRVQEFLEKNRVTFVLEATAGLSLSREALNRKIRCPEKSLPVGFDSGFFESVLRIGGVPTLRFWRDLEEKRAQIPVTSVSRLAFSGLSRASTVLRSFEALHHLQLAPSRADLEKFFLRDLEFFRVLLALLEKYPRSEASLVRDFSRVCAGQSLYLGNSLPIREWDLVASEVRTKNVWANRGANGIDGQISSFLGWSDESCTSAAFALIGDLTALYDLAALWISARLTQRKRRLVIVNNGGGQIFKSLFGREVFLNSHQMRFQKWAEMWGWDFAQVSDSSQIESLAENTAEHLVVELLPDSLQSQLFREEWKKVL